MKNKVYQFNINCEVEVELTEAGKKILKEHYQHYPENIRPEINNYFKAELWQIMNIFGNYLINGGKTPFKNNVINIRKEIDYD